MTKINILEYILYLKSHMFRGWNNPTKYPECLINIKFNKL